MASKRAAESRRWRGDAHAERPRDHETRIELCIALNLTRAGKRSTLREGRLGEPSFCVGVTIVGGSLK